MKTVQLHRDSDDGHQTLGRVYVFDDNKMIFECKSLELPYLDNKRRISCYPAGTFFCEMTMSNRFKKMMYLVKDVPNRDGIRWHSANYVEQLAGCTALGSEHKDLDLDGDMDVIHSGNTIKAFEKILNYEPFKLGVYDFT